MWVNGKKINSMEKELKRDKMVLNMKVNILKERNTGLESCILQMVVVMRDNLITMIYMVNIKKKKKKKNNKNFIFC